MCWRLIIRYLGMVSSRDVLYMTGIHHSLCCPTYVMSWILNSHLQAQPTKRYAHTFKKLNTIVCTVRWINMALKCNKHMALKCNKNHIYPIFCVWNNFLTQDISIACGICYTYRMEESLPDQVCEDKRCAQPFHATCLYEVTVPQQ